MDTQGKVNKRLFKKTELATQRIELGLLDDLKKAESDLYAASQKSGGSLGAVRKAIQNADKLFTNQLRVAENAEEIADKFIRAAKELGVDSKIANGIKKLAASLEADAERRIKSLNADQYN